MPLQALAAIEPAEQDPNNNGGGGGGNEAFHSLMLSVYPEEIHVGQNVLVKALISPAYSGKTVTFGAYGIQSELYQTQVETINGQALTTWVPNEVGQATISAVATVNGQTKATSITVNVLPAEETLRERFNLNYDMDFYIYSPPRWLGRNIHWNDPVLARIDTNVNNVADKTLRVTFEDWIDNSYDDVTFAINAQADKIVVTKESVNTACPDRTHLVLKFDTEKTITVKTTDPAVSVTNVQGTEVFTGKEFDILLWNHVVYDTWKQKTITISEATHSDLEDISLDLSPDQVKVGSPIVVKATVNPKMSGKTVYFSSTGVAGEFVQVSTQTNSNGVAYTQFTPSQAGQGTIAAKVAHNGVTRYANAQFTATDVVTSSITLFVDIDKNQIKVGDSTKVTATARYMDGQPFAGKTVTFKHDGVNGYFSNDQVVTDSNGQAVVKFTPTSSGSGNVRAELSHNGYNYYANRFFQSYKEPVIEPVDSRVSIQLDPYHLYVNNGETGTYRVNVKDLRPRIQCAVPYEAQPAPQEIAVTDGVVAKIYPIQPIVPCNQPRQIYNLVVEGISFEHDMISQVSLAPQESRTFDLKVYPKILDYDASQPNTRIYDVNIIANHIVNSKPGPYSEFAGSGQARLYLNYGSDNPEDPEVPPEFPEEPRELVEMELQKGWNLVSLPGELVKFESNSLDRKLLGYVYLNGGYVTLQDAKKKLGTGFNTYLAEHAFWIYSYNTYTLQATVKPSEAPVKLSTGWNLVPVRYFYKQNTVISMIGNCNVPIIHHENGESEELGQSCGIESMYGWNAYEQKWEKRSLYYHFRDTQRYSDIGTGFIMKMSKSTELRQVE